MPLVTGRDFHSLSPWAGWRPETVEVDGFGGTIRHEAVTPRLRAEGGSCEGAGDWWGNFHHREEAARGLDNRADLYAPVRFTATLAVGETLVLTFTTEPGEPDSTASSPRALVHRHAGLIFQAGLLASHGLRSLSPTDIAYRGAYLGGPLERDGAYHQGPVWTWLIGAFVEAHYRAYGDRAVARSFLLPFIDHLQDADLGAVSELLDGDPPRLPRGCIAQAWRVAEVLRVWRLLGRE